VRPGNETGRCPVGAGSGPNENGVGRVTSTSSARRPKQHRQPKRMARFVSSIARGRAADKPVPSTLHDCDSAGTALVFLAVALAEDSWLKCSAEAAQRPTGEWQLVCWLPSAEQVAAPVGMGMEAVDGGPKW
jgi:hypothetical protein